MKALVRAKGTEQSILISDAVALAGLQPGIYDAEVGGKVELLPSERIQLQGTPFLAGSASSLPECIANAVRLADVALLDAVRMASVNPRRLFGLDGGDQHGSLCSGVAADITLFRLGSPAQGVQIEATIVRGEMVYSHGTA